MMELNTAWEFGTGVRTFSLVALFGAISVYASELSGLPWIVGLVFLAILALVITAYYLTARDGNIGSTTEVSVLITFFVASAAQVYFGDTGLYLAGALAGLTDVDAIALSMANLAQQDPASSGAAAAWLVG